MSGMVNESSGMFELDLKREDNCDTDSFISVMMH